MKKTYNLILSIILIGIFALPSLAGHLGSELLVTAKLTGSQEVPAVTTSAVGLASFTISENRDSVNYNIVVNGLSGAITGIHIHDGAAGVNGGVVVNLTSNVKGNQVIGSIATADVTSSFIAKLLTEGYYLNVHTADNPNGEIRGQLKLETDLGLFSTLDTLQQNHSVTNNAAGSAIFDISHDGKTLTYYVVTDGLSGDITAAHLHNGAVGVDGGVALNLSSGISGKTLNGKIDISQSTTLIADILAGNVYINIHTTANPNGEIRGQMKKTAGLAFDTKLTTGQETTTVIGSNAYGTGHLALSATFDTLWYSFLATDLSGSLTGAHIHDGAVGSSGGVLLNLTSSINGNWVEGMVTGSALTNEVIEKLLSGETYINFHTSLNANGEIRGQLYRTAREGYSYNLTGSQEIPASLTNGYGVGIVSIDRNQSNAHYMVVVDNLSGPITGAHFHNATAGNNGNVVFNLSSSFSLTNNYDGAFGYWNASSSSAFTTTNSVQFRNEAIYINIHTAAYAGGELRGNTVRGFTNFAFEEINNGDIPTDITYGGGILYSARLTGDQEVPAATTNASGVIGVLVSADNTSVKLNATFANLGSKFTGAHIHEGAAGTNGSVVLDLMPFVNGNQISAEITTLDMVKLAQGLYYINVHSEDLPNGEIRGQLKLETEISFIADINGANELPAVTTDAKGLGHFYLTQNNTKLKFKVVFDDLSGPIMGAHLHSGAKDINGGVVADLSAMVSGNTITGTLDPSVYLADLLAGNIYINIHTAANANGEIRGQLDMSNGFVYESWMNGAQAMPVSNTTANGLAIFELAYDMKNMNYWVQSAGLSGDITAVHLHNGRIGQSGGVALDLGTGINGKLTNGTALEAELTASVIASLNTGDLYINAHTLAFPAGEVRGQVFRMARDGYTFEQCGNQEVPAVESKGYGSTILAIDRDNSFMHMMMVNTNLSEEVTAAHIHEGEVGATGEVLLALSLDGNNYFAYADTTSFSASIFDKIKSGNAYVNVHTATNASGELRGQIDNETDCPTAPANTSNVNNLNVYSGAMYPNPATTLVTLDLGTYSKNATVQVYNVLGAEVISTSVSGVSSINLTTIPTGMYTVVVTGDNLIYTQKLIKN